MEMQPISPKSAYSRYNYKNKIIGAVLGCYLARLQANIILVGCQEVEFDCIIY